MTSFDSILPQALQSATIADRKVLRYSSSRIDLNSLYRDVTGSLVVTFEVPTYIVRIVRYPVGIMQGLAQLGGLMAAFKAVNIILFVANKHLFKKEAKGKLGIQEGEDIEKRYSLERFE